MPAFVIASQQCRAGKTIDAQLCAPGPAGYPDERNATPVKATISEKAIKIDNEERPRAIISCTRINGATTYLVGGSTMAVRSSEQRAALAKAHTVLQRLTTSLRPLIAVSEEPELAMEALQLLFDWIRNERGRLTEGP